MIHIHMLYNDTKSALTENYVGFEIINNNLIFVFFFNSSYLFDIQYF